MAIAINTPMGASAQSGLHPKYDFRLKAADVAGVRDTAKPFYVYMYRDTRDGKIGAPLYVGKGHDNKDKPNQYRARQHWNQCTSNAILQRVFDQMRSLGIKPELEILVRFSSEQEAFEYEISLILELGRRNLRNGPLCNLADGGAGPLGAITSKETRIKLSEACKRSHASPEVRAKIAAASRQMHSDPVFCERRAKAVSVALQRPEAKAARSLFMAEVHSRPGDRERRTASQRAAFSTPEHKALRSKASKASQARPETKARHAAGLRRRHANPEYKAKQVASLIAMHADPVKSKKHKDGCAEFNLKRTLEDKTQMLQYLLPSWIF